MQRDDGTVGQMVVRRTWDFMQHMILAGWRLFYVEDDDRTGTALYGSCGAVRRPSRNILQRRECRPSSQTRGHCGICGEICGYYVAMHCDRCGLQPLCGHWACLAWRTTTNNTTTMGRPRMDQRRWMGTWTRILGVVSLLHVAEARQISMILPVNLLAAPTMTGVEEWAVVIWARVMEGNSEGFHSLLLSALNFMVPPEAKFGSSSSLLAVLICHMIVGWSVVRVSNALKRLKPPRWAVRMARLGFRGFGKALRDRIPELLVHMQSVIRGSEASGEAFT